MKYFPFDEEKALNAVLFIIHGLGGKATKLQIAKILYFADQKHLVSYGRDIAGGHYLKEDKGPVPAELYQAFEGSKYTSILNALTISGDVVSANRDIDMDCLSGSDAECLSLSIHENRRFTDSELSEKSHGSAWQSATEENPISIEAIAKEAGAEQGLVEYIMDNISDYNLALA
jgi:uncharacterized phage-associated protein